MQSDLRSWLKEVEGHGELKRLSGVDCDLEMSGICEIIVGEKTDPNPVLMFEDIPGHPKGFRTLYSLFGSPWRTAKTLGLPEEETDRMALLRNWNKKVDKIPMIPPRMVTSAPFMENVDTGGDVDLLKFPSPKHHELDGGRYFGTCHGVIQRDPDTGYVNMGTYRVMLLDKNRLALQGRNVLAPIDKHAADSVAFIVIELGHRVSIFLLILRTGIHRIWPHSTNSECRGESALTQAPTVVSTGDTDIYFLYLVLPNVANVHRAVRIE